MENIFGPKKLHPDPKFKMQICIDYFVAKILEAQLWDAMRNEGRGRPENKSRFQVLLEMQNECFNVELRALGLDHQNDYLTLIFW